jgi:hypothetical protein
MSTENPIIPLTLGGAEEREEEEGGEEDLFKIVTRDKKRW